MLTSQVGEDVGVSGSDVLGVLSLEGAAWTALSIQKNSIRNEIMVSVYSISIRGLVSEIKGVLFSGFVKNLDLDVNFYSMGFKSVFTMFLIYIPCICTTLLYVYCTIGTIMYIHIYEGSVWFYYVLRVVVTIVQYTSTYAKVLVPRYE